MTEKWYAESLGEPARLAATGIIASDPTTRRSLDRLASLAATVLNAPVALVSLVESDRQFFAGQCGLPESVASMRETPLSHSFCQHVAVTTEPLLVEDAREHPLVNENRAIADLGVIAYAGFPLVTAGGLTLGSLCVIDHEPRPWLGAEVRLLESVAEAVVGQLELRLEVERRRQIELALERIRAVCHSVL